MARVVCVHGIGAQMSGAESVLQDWYPALADGMAAAGPRILARRDVAAVFYGDLFHPRGQPHPADDPPYGPLDVARGWEREMLRAWWHGAETADPSAPPPPADVPVEMMVHRVARTPFFAGVSTSAVIRDLLQLRRYLSEHELRRRAQERFLTVLGPETVVVVAHSLGSVVAYEALCALPQHHVRALVTLGSPLGIPDLVFDRLVPAPVGGLGRWPGGKDMIWTNIADRGDLMAPVRDLRGCFGPRVRNALVYNDVHAHSAAAYLTDELTGQAVGDGLYAW